ncbi:MAG: ATP synthase F0 subunit B [Deltaproteobacteria bacterium]
MNPNGLILLNTLAAAGGGGHGEMDWFVIASIITNAVLFFGFLAVKLRPVVREGLSNRRANMAKQLEEAKQKQAEAEKRLEEYAKKLENLEDEVERIVEAYEAEAKADAERMKEETEKAIVRMQRESEFTINQEIRKVENFIRGEAVKATMEAAEQLVKERITDADRRRLTDQYITELEKQPS